MSRLLVVASLAVALSGCAVSLRNPNISDLQHHPGRYQDQTVSINGVVTSSWGLPLVPFRFYRVDDGTGEVTVLSDGRRRMPATGERVRVRGRVEDVAVIGGRPLGLHLREDDVYIKR
jgi:outer membrane lipoprotein SlyB